MASPAAQLEGALNGGIMDAAELKALLHLAKRTPVSSAIGMTKDKQGIVLLHKRTKPRKLMAELLRLAKAGPELDRASIRFGRASIDGGSDGTTVHFIVNKEPPGPLRMRLTETLRQVGFQRCTITVDEALETEPDQEQPADDRPAGGSPPPRTTPPTSPAAAPGATPPAATTSPSPTTPEAAAIRSRLTGLVRQALDKSKAGGASNADILPTAVAARDALATGDLTGASQATDRLASLLAASPAATIPSTTRQQTVIPQKIAQSEPQGGAPDSRQTAPQPPPTPEPPYRRLTIRVPADCPSIAELERLMDRHSGTAEGTPWDWHGPPPAIETLRGKDLDYDVPAPPPAPEIVVSGAHPSPATMQQATDQAWNDVDQSKIATMPEDQRAALARQKADEMTKAQLRFMAEHPGATAADFAKSALLLNSPQQLHQAYDDIKEALNGDANAYARIAAAAGGTAQISGWLLALVGVVYIASWATGVGEVATLAAGLAVAAEALLATNVVASAIEAEARLKAASQTNDPAEFRRQTEGAAAAQTNIVMSVAAIAGMKALEITARIPAVKGALDSVRASLKDLRERIGHDAVAVLKPKVLQTMGDARTRLAEALETAKALAAKEAADLDAMSVDQFAQQAGKPGGIATTGPQGAPIDYARQMATPEGKAAVATAKQQLATALKHDVPALLDQQFAHYTAAIDAFMRAAEAARDNRQLAASATQLEKMLGEPAARAMLAQDQSGLVRDAASRTASTDPDPRRHDTDPPPDDPVADEPSGDDAQGRSKGQQQAEALGIGDLLADHPGYHFRFNPSGKEPFIVRASKSQPQLALRSDGAGGYAVVEVGASVVMPAIKPLPEGVTARVPSEALETVMTPPERETYRSALQTRAEAQARIKARDDAESPESKADYQTMRQASEQIGEISATAYMRTEFPGSERVFGTPEGLPGRRGQFDQIWRQQLDDGSVRYIVVEAKGGASGTSTAKVDGKTVAQGTPEYFDSTVVQMLDQQGQAADVAEQLTDIRRNGRVMIDGRSHPAEISYLRVQTPIEKPASAIDGRPVNQAASTHALQYDISPRSQ